MLSASRCEAESYRIPKFSLDRGDVDDFMEELRGFHDQFRKCFMRSEPREHFWLYMSGQFSPLERKSIEPIALQMEDGNVRAMQRFVSDVVWDEKLMLDQYYNLVNEDLGDPEGILIFDESGFAKKGDDSVGVARQYCGSTGKVDNCQVGVFAAYASRHGYAFLDKRLYIPEKWFDDSHTSRRRKCKIPSDLTFQTKPRLAADMYRRLRDESDIPFKYVVADSVYGANSDFIGAIEEKVGTTYFVSVHSDTSCWLQEPSTEARTVRGKEGKKLKRVVSEKERKPVDFATLAKGINSFFWYRRKVSEGTKGPIEYEFTKRRVTLCREGLPYRRVWLIIKRTPGVNREYSYYISNAPLSTRLKVFVWLSGVRWAIEQCFEEAKTELGMDHYEVRKYPGWNHHMLTCMLSHFFLWHLNIKLGKKSTVYYTLAA
jgi:SRSO17 transposase